jgi:hypothetical protein
MKVRGGNDQTTERRRQRHTKDEPKAMTKAKTQEILHETREDTDGKNRRQKEVKRKSRKKSNAKYLLILLNNSL